MWPSFAEHWEGVSTLLDGRWRGPRGEVYQMSFEEPGPDSVTGCCRRHNGRGDRNHARTFSVCYDYETCLLWWGIQRKFCLDPEEVRINPQRARWYIAGKEAAEFEASSELIETNEIISFSFFQFQCLWFFYTVAAVVDLGLPAFKVMGKPKVFFKIDAPFLFDFGKILCVNFIIFDLFVHFSQWPCFNMFFVASSICFTSTCKLLYKALPTHKHWNSSPRKCCIRWQIWNWNPPKRRKVTPASVKN